MIKKVDHVKYVLLLGTEMQTYIDYSMPVRIMDYDALEYNEQIQTIDTARKNEESGKSRKLELSRLRKEDRLVPVITLVLYIGKEPWDAAKSLHGILDLSRIPEELLTYIQFLIESYQEIGATYENTQFQIELKYRLDSSLAEKYMKLYWK